MFARYQVRILLWTNLLNLCYTPVAPALQAGVILPPELSCKKLPCG